jgi:hypothetical protein
VEQFKEGWYQFFFKDLTVNLKCKEETVLEGKPYPLEIYKVYLAAGIKWLG